MKKIPKFIILLCLSFCFNFPAFSRGLGDLTLSNSFDTPVEPRLLYPTSDEVDLSGKSSLEFKWFPYFTNTRQYIFKLYKGYHMSKDGLIVQQDLPADASTFEVKAEMFEDGQVYTWSLVRVSQSGQKSDKSFNSFRVTKQ